jgi:hypothetical protein
MNIKFKPKRICLSDVSYSDKKNNTTLIYQFYTVFFMFPEHFEKWTYPVIAPEPSIIGSYVHDKSVLYT